MKYRTKACYFLIGLFLLSAGVLVAQSKSEADSLKQIYSKNIKTGEDKLELLAYLAFHTTDSLEESLSYANELIVLASKSNNTKYLSSAHSQKGQAYRIAGNYDDALNEFLKSCTYAQELQNKKFLGGGYLAIADTYSQLGNSETASDYYLKSINILKKTNDSLTLASALLNAGDEYYNSKKFEKALYNFRESSRIFEVLNYPIGSAYNLGNMGMVYAQKGEDSLALHYMNNSMMILESSQAFDAISEYLNSISEIYARQGKIENAIAFSLNSLDLVRRTKMKKQISESHLNLSQLYKELGNSDSTYYHFNQGIVYRDSIRNLEVIEDMADQLLDFEVSQEQTKTQLSEQKRKNQRIILFATLGVLFLIALLAYGLFRRNKFVQKTNKIIAKEKERSDNLLLNILPEETAEELKEKGRVAAKKYNAVTVLFSDFKGFTSYAENLSPEELVQTIDYYFTAFDGIMGKYGLEKIKTIGDAYMAVGGLSLDSSNQANDMLLAAKEMNEFVAKAKNDTHTTATFDIRIGINTGPVVAGVVGTKKFAYDIWGDTVNIAARMESSSEPGRINISEDTYNIVKNDFKCDYRGELAVKNRGILKMYFVNC